MTDQSQTINLADINLIGTDHWVDLISEQPVDDLAAKLTLSPYQSLWLTNRVDGVGSQVRTGAD